MLFISLVISFSAMDNNPGEGIENMLLLWFEQILLHFIFVIFSKKSLFELKFLITFDIFLESHKKF